MARFIDANKAIELIRNNPIENLYYNKQNAIDCIEAMPTADVVEVVHAEWVRYGQTCIFVCSKCGRQVSELRKIDNCHYVEAIDILDEYPYCHCGAKMDKEVDVVE